MLNDMKRKNIDLLIEHFWKQGYLTVSRKFGTYLPEPPKVGEFDVDIIAKFKKNYAIGITLAPEELNDKNILAKISYLATRKTKYSNSRVMLFVGISNEYYKNAKMMIDLLEEDVKKNIKLFPIVERISFKRKRTDLKANYLFS